MKNFFRMLLLLGLSLRSFPAVSQNLGATDDAAGTSRFAVQKTVVYPVPDAARISAVIDWYSKFFGQPPVTVDLAAPHPYAVYAVDGVEVRLETNPRFVQLRQAVFYWVLPSPADVDRKYAALDADPANRFERSLFQRVRQLEGRRSDGSAAAPAGTAVTQVKEFIVLDPAGNEVGVINNPIYPPPTTVSGER